MENRNSSFNQWDLATAAATYGLNSPSTLPTSPFLWPTPTPQSPLTSAAFQLQLSAARLSPPSSPSSAPPFLSSTESSPADHFPFSRLLSHMSVRASIADSLSSYCSALTLASQDTSTTRRDADKDTHGKKVLPAPEEDDDVIIDAPPASPSLCTWRVPTKLNRNKDAENVRSNV